MLIGILHPLTSYPSLGPNLRAPIPSDPILGMALLYTANSTIVPAVHPVLMGLLVAIIGYQLYDGIAAAATGSICAAAFRTPAFVGVEQLGCVTQTLRSAATLPILALCASGAGVRGT